MITQDTIDRIRRRHPLQYGLLRNRMIVYETGNDDNPEIAQRFNRCPNCEQWSPCDVREVLEAYVSEHKSEDMTP